MALADKVSLEEESRSLSGFWEPRTVARLNGQHVKLARFRGEFVWHRHENADELFLVIRGSFDLRLRDRTVTVGEGEFAVVPRGIDHCPSADDEALVLLFEPEGTERTGDPQTSEGGGASEADGSARAGARRKGDP